MTVLYSFDKSGFERHIKKNNSPLSFLKNTKALVTGGTSGIGYATAQTLARSDVSVTVSGRNKEKGQKAVENQTNLKFIQWDMADWDQIPELVQKLDTLDYIVLNAGGMPEEYQKNKDGMELQFASQLFGHYYFIHELKAQSKLSQGARIVWVTSGGMYLSKLNIEKIFDESNYDKVSMYANVKRAQVELLSHFKDEFPNCVVTAMHPGWVDTQALRESIPGFTKLMKKRLRTPEQGADTILWLLSQSTQPTSGELYFDRELVQKHYFPFTKSAPNTVQELQSLLIKFKPRSLGESKS